MNSETKKLRKAILKVSFLQQAGHIPSAFSILEILYSLYKEHMGTDDVFVLSKGHGCLALYAVFLEMGFITEGEFYSFGQYNSILGGHPHRAKHSKIYASTGSLGHGLPICLGSALAKKIRGKKSRVFCLIGDGECNEGTIWEAAMIASNLSLSNLVCIVDDNNSQTRSLPSKNIGQKFRAFGWNVILVKDGHNLDELDHAIKIADNQKEHPSCIVCKTVKGKGVLDMEQGMFAWHHGPPSKEEYLRFCQELDA